MCPVELTASDVVTLEEEQLVNRERAYDSIVLIRKVRMKTDNFLFDQKEIIL